MNEQQQFPRLQARREELQYRIHANNEQIRYFRSPGVEAADRELAVSNLMMENALNQAEIEEIAAVVDRFDHSSNEWSRRAYMVLFVVALVVLTLAIIGLGRAL